LFPFFIFSHLSAEQRPDKVDCLNWLLHHPKCEAKQAIVAFVGVLPHFANVNKTLGKAPNQLCYKWYTFQ
jgi:hypothetical protein